MKNRNKNQFFIIRILITAQVKVILFGLWLKNFFIDFFSLQGEPYFETHR